MSDTIVKAGRTLTVLARGKGRVLRECKSACCAEWPKSNRFTLLPCGCHSLIVLCTCKVRDRQCRRCRRVFVTAPGGWAEVADPHAKESTR